LTALAKSVERDMIEDEMRKLASSQIIRQMARLKANIEAGTMLSEEELAAQLEKEQAQLAYQEKQYSVKTTTQGDSNHSVGQ
jgi:LPS-assembly lipoprotein